MLFPCRSVLLVFLCAAAASAQAQVHGASPLEAGAIEAVPPFSETHPRVTAAGLSADGARVVGVAAVEGPPSTEWPPAAVRPFMWASGEGFREIVMPDTLGVVAFEAETAISSDGSVVVGTLHLAEADPLVVSTVTRAFRWSEDAGFDWLASSEAESSEAYAVSSDGSAVLGRVTIAPVRAASLEGGLSPPREAGTSHQVLWRGGRRVRIPPPPEHDRLRVRDLSGDGEVVVGTGFASGASSSRAAFRWTAEAGSVLIPGLDAYSTSEALAVSEDGRVVVGYAYNGGWSNLPEAVAFRWSEGDGLQLLGRWVARDVSADGSTVVGSYQTAVAVVWTPEAGARFARDVFDADGWWLMSIDAVSADGLFVLGGGETPDGTETAWRGRMPAE